MCDHSAVSNVVMCSVEVIQGNLMKIKRVGMTHSINPCLITSDLIISDTDINTPMDGEQRHKRFFKNRTSAGFC